uniref:Putative secreted protein n=1 Tax=Anopheles marajoara TaxID=58244 RepID=A0A2M4CAG3_9DIPT
MSPRGVGLACLCWLTGCQQSVSRCLWWRARSKGWGEGVSGMLFQLCEPAETRSRSTLSEKHIYRLMNVLWPRELRTGPTISFISR